MKGESQIKGETQELVKPAVFGPGLAPEDPFAGDLFASRKSSEGEAKSAATRGKKKPGLISSAWHSRLPQVTNAEVQASAAIDALPAEFYTQMRESVISVLSRYTLNLPNQVSVVLTEFYDTDFSFALAAQGSPRVFATFVCEPNRTPVTIELEARFSIMLIDRMLGGSGDSPNSLRSLTTAELAVVEFLFLSMASELNQQVGAPLMRLQNVGVQPPWLTGALGSANTDTYDLTQHGLSAAWRIDVGKIAGMAHAHLPAQSLNQINMAQKQLRETGSNRALPHADAKVRSYASIAPDLPLCILVGKTDLTSAEFTGLECGDVMVVESPDLVWRNGQVSGSLRVQVADGEEALILGEASDITRSTIKLKVASVTIGDSGGWGGRFNMQEEIETEEAAPEEANAIDGVMLTVHVELTARRLRLDELARLRPNQVLELGCQATDPVDLVVDGRHVARGELVDIEGRLGVRIKQVSTRAA